MPRAARAKSATDVYHVMLRGINRQRIFKEEEDYQRFLQILRRYQPQCGYALYAWCLMPNHIHLLIKEGAEPLDQVFRRIGASFVYWYNIKYDRTGHLFQDRYKSEAVEDERYFRTVLRYIHRNPVKAGLCAKPSEYPYSSYDGYFENEAVDHSLADALMEREEFVRYHEAVEDDICMDVHEETSRRITDEQTQKIMAERYGCRDAAQVQALSEEKKTALVRVLLREGASIRQVSRATGISVGIVRKVR